VGILSLDKKEELRKIMESSSKSHSFDMSPLLSEI